LKTKGLSERLYFSLVKGATGGSYSYSSEPLAKIPEAVLARVDLLFSFVLEAMRSLFRQLVAAASPWSAVFDHIATLPSEFTQVFSFPEPYRLRDQSQNLICGQRNDTEHKMAHHLGADSHPHRAPAETRL
jgi:hypothetical protein